MHRGKISVTLAGTTGKPGADSTRAEIEHKALCAIEKLKAEGYIIRIKDLVEYTGLSRSVFAKTHIRKLLENYKIGNLSQKGSKQDGNIHRDKMDERIKRLTEANTELKKECELLRGRLFLLIQKEKKQYCKKKSTTNFRILRNWMLIFN